MNQDPRFLMNLSTASVSIEKARTSNVVDDKFLTPGH
jgi:hypothetical protein